jgi:yecA family protein
MMPKMNTRDRQTLSAFLDSPDRPEGTLRFHELQGFLFAMASSPETVAPSEWMPIVSGDEESLGYADIDEAQRMLGLLMGLYNEVNEGVLERRAELPAGCTLADDIDANFDENASISQWSRGFMIGYDYLSKVWDHHLIGDMSNEMGLHMMTLSFFSNRELAEAYFAEFVPARERRRKDAFVEFAGQVRDRFTAAMSLYADLGRTLFEGSFDEPRPLSRSGGSRKTGRNETCPCGSGIKYKKCCGSRVH